MALLLCLGRSASPGDLVTSRDTGSGPRRQRSQHRRRRNRTSASQTHKSTRKVATGLARRPPRARVSPAACWSAGPTRAGNMGAMCGCLCTEDGVRSAPYIHKDCGVGVLSSSAWSRRTPFRKMHIYPRGNTPVFRLSSPPPIDRGQWGQNLPARYYGVQEYGVTRKF